MITLSSPTSLPPCCALVETKRDNSDCFPSEHKRYRRTEIESAFKKNRADQKGRGRGRGGGGRTERREGGSNGPGLDNNNLTNNN